MRRFVLCSIGALALAPASAAQTHRTILTQAVDGAEWAVGSVAHLRFGRVAVVAAPDGPRLEVRRLRDVIPTPPTLRIEGATPSFTGNNLVVGDFAQSNRSALGGYFSTFARAPSEGSATVGPTADNRRALTLSCDKADSGFCGLWIQLYDFEAAPDTRSYLDGTPFSTLSFWIRGHRGGERLLLKVADARRELKQDALVIGDLGDFLPSGRVDTAWQQAVVPLDRFPPRIDRATLALLVWEAVSQGRADIDLGRVAFSLRPTALPSLPEPTTEPSSSRPEHLATWLWNTRALLADSTHRDTLLDALAREGFDRVFLQLPDPPGQRGVPGEITIDAATLRPLMAAFSRRGMAVYALDGYARYALPAFHAGVLRTVDHVIRYNSESKPSERFIGIRYDIEPYILPAFHGPDREHVVRQLLDLTARSAERARAAGLAYGVDIPFWYDAPDEATSERVIVEWNGVRKPLNEHLIDLVDDVSIMDYRTIAYGADGTIRHATGRADLRGQTGQTGVHRARDVGTPRRGAARVQGRAYARPAGHLAGGLRGGPGTARRFDSRLSRAGGQRAETRRRAGPWPVVRGPGARSSGPLVVARHAPRGCAASKITFARHDAAPAPRGDGRHQGRTRALPVVRGVRAPLCGELSGTGQ